MFCGYSVKSVHIFEICAYFVKMCLFVYLSCICIYFVLYFVIFYFAIKVFKLPTPAVDDEESKVSPEVGLDPVAYIEALGGESNIVSVDACITRLRLGVNDCSLFNEEALKALGSKGVVRIGKQSAQVILGPKAESIANSIKATIE